METANKVVKAKVQPIRPTEKTKLRMAPAVNPSAQAKRSTVAGNTAGRLYAQISAGRKAFANKLNCPS